MGSKRVGKARVRGINGAKGLRGGIGLGIRWKVYNKRKKRESVERREERQRRKRSMDAGATPSG